MKTAALSVLLALCVAPALAQENCPPLKQLASIPMVRSRDGQNYVPVKINGAERLLKLDTGGAITSIFPEAADDLNLPTRRTNAALVDMNGNISNRSARAQSFDLGGIVLTRALDFMVLPSRNPGYANNKRAGNLALDLLRPYDIEMDFEAGRLNLFSPEHCEGRVVYWSADTVAAIPIRLDSQGKPRVPVKLDGVELSAVIDTGAPTTILNLSVGTRRLALDLNAPDVQKFGVAGNVVYRKRFQTLELSGLFIANPFVSILPDKMGEGVRDAAGRFVRSEERQPDLLIGSSILNRLHVYLATKEEVLYVSGAMPPSASTQAPAEGGT
jgi:predicted aspartyl protease